MAKTGNMQIDHNHPLFLQQTDTHGIALIDIKLTGPENYALWSRSMRMALLVKNKLGFIDGTCLKSSYRGELGHKWERCNAVVLSWIGRTVSTELKPSIIYASDARKVWNEFKERFNKSNLTRFYHLWTTIGTLRQGTDSITSYYTKMKDLWDEMDLMVPGAGCELSGN
ncbi:uncharacterized protein LOC142172074 [Nicotiana tabacum]|uniref:Uncharacterized protein LOC142172074 n=1 Tax=Nicotiana tabacum TaxID=4097 RepID=A0AC58T3Z6_TOBAC